MDLTTFSTPLSISINDIESLINNKTLALTPQMSEVMEKLATIDSSSLFSSLDLKKLLPKSQTSYANALSGYTLSNPMPIESLPKNFNDYESLFPNFKAPEKTTTNVPVSSLHAARTLFADTKRDLSPVEKLLDENYRELHSTIQQAISAARTARIKFEDKLLSKPLHPYQKLIYQYLGPDFTSPSIDDVPLPETFCPKQATEDVEKISMYYSNFAVTQFQHLTAGIGKIENDDERALLEGLGHAFTVLSSTPTGEAMFAIDKEKTAKYLEFAELVRNIPVSQILSNPIEIAQKVVSRYIEILLPTQPMLPAYESSQQRSQPSALLNQVN